MFNCFSLIIFACLVTTIYAQNNIGSSNSETPADPWPLFRGNPQLTGVSSSPLPENPELLWTFTARGDIESTAAIFQNTVYVASLDSHLYAIDLNSGKLKWKFGAADETKSSPSVSNGVVYFGDESGAFHAVDAFTGKRKWLFHADAAIISSANFHNGRVLFGSYDNYLYCLNAIDGALLWKFETEGYIHGTPAIANDTVVVAGCDGYLRMIRIRDGVEIKKGLAGAYVAASPAVNNGRAYVGTFGNKIICMDLASAKTVWEYDHPRKDFPFYSSAAITDKLLVVGGRDKMVHGIDRETGKGIWNVAAKSKIDSSPVISGTRAFIGISGGELLAIDVNTGKTVWQFETGSSILASPSIGYGKLVISSTDGVVYCFGEK